MKVTVYRVYCREGERLQVLLERAFRLFLKRGGTAGS